MSSTNYREMAEKSAVASFVFNVDNGQFTFANTALLKLLNTDKKGLTIDYIKQIIHPEDFNYAEKSLSDLISGIPSEHVLFRIVIKNKHKWIRIFAMVSDEAEGGKKVLGNLIDNTAEVESEHVFEKYANKKNAILNILAHDLTGPLSMSNMLISSLKSASRNPAELHLIDSVIKINKQATALINDLTSREFLETVDVVLSKKRINIAPKIKEYVEEYQHSAEAMKRTFNFSASAETIFVNLDEPKFFQVMNNLTTNALKFTHEHGTISVAVEETNDAILISVADDGIGIPEEYQGILFDKFTEARRKGLQGEPTLGLGMYVIKQIVEWHEGKVWVVSEEGNGTTVYVELPKA